jgi:hypothetical protein
MSPDQYSSAPAVSAEELDKLQDFDLFVEELPELTDFGPVSSVSTSGCSCVASLSTIACIRNN